jgi:signal transduction histidine kinase
VIKNILLVLPETNAIAVVIGNSPNEQYWLEQIRSVVQPYTNQIAFAWLNDLSFDEMLKRTATLSPKSAILFYQVSVDAAGHSHEGGQALARLRAVANAPIFTYIDTDFGNGIVGGSLMSVSDVAQQTASVAMRILGGEAPSDIKPLPIGHGTTKYDWRELQRWNIAESGLPPGSEVHFREPSAWERYRVQMLAIIAAFLAQAMLIGWLFYEHRRRHLAEILARNSMAELTHVNRIATVGEFSASIAHEVNQPLTGIVTRASAGRNWLNGAKPDIEKARDAFDQIEAAGHRAGVIIKNLKSMFRKDTQDKSQVDINQLIRSVLGLVEIELRRHGIYLQSRLGDQVPPVIGNPVQLQQVILNLIMNAIDAMHPVRQGVLSVESKLNGHGIVQVSIEDNGTGIDPANLSQIFKPMFTTKDHGMGMGLSICHSIIENHNGRIWVTAGIEGGAAFHFELSTKGV